MQLQALLPLVTHPDPNSDIVAAHAVAVANLIRAEIHALAINVDIPPVSNALSRFLLDVPEMIRGAEAQSRKRGEHLLALIEQAATPAGITSRKSAISAPLALLAETAAIQARYFDLALVGLEAGNQTSRATAEAVIFGSGRPSVLLPELCDIGAMDHVAIAWDGSRVAARAVGDALPFLQRADRVSVLTVVDEKPLKERDAGERLVEGLRSRGLDAETVALRSEDCPIAATLQQRAIERGAGLLVMGGYGHSRVRDFVLGGATNGVLNDPLMPILISH
ncbi:universal stress protein [Aquamicrobium terrae]|uniref:Nucleotide-binding universal stress UspA family protein n=1 Tax=Aquamicrobium terrae TaxID=1324945 RepID=A0ABV2MZZ7_9HYPH